MSIANSAQSSRTSRELNVSIIIVNWNGGATIRHCLASLCAQTYHDFQVIIVDNGSTDGSLDDLPEGAPALNYHVERLLENRGFAAANNIGARLARGAWLALLNPDAFPQADWLEHLVEATRRYPSSTFFASRLVQAKDPSRLDGEGDAYHVSGVTWRRNHNASVSPIADEREVFSACAAAALYSRQSFLQVGGFDEDYFCYDEDVDLGFRLRMLGSRCIYVPRAVVHHLGASSYGDKSDFMIYYGHRNMVWTYLKDMPTSLFWWYLPRHLMTNLVYFAYFTFRGHGKVIFRAKVDALKGINAALRKRTELQRMRRASSADLGRVMNQGWVEPYLPVWRRS